MRLTSRNGKNRSLGLLRIIRLSLGLALELDSVIVAVPPLITMTMAALMRLSHSSY
jgi:hypothetical protein